MPSEKVLEQKKQAVADLSANLKESCVGVIVDYKGINVADDTKLRKELREAGDTYIVVKNTLLGRALQEAGIEGLESVLEGTTAIAYNKENYISAAKILSKYAEENKNFTIKAGFIDGNVVDVAAIKELGNLPSKEVLVAKALGGLNAPIAGFAGVLGGTLRSLVIALNAVAQKQSA